MIDKAQDVEERLESVLREAWELLPDDGLSIINKVAKLFGWDFEESRL